jgi:hypothetical protein
MDASKRYAETMAAAEKKRATKVKKIDARYDSAVEPARLKYREVETKAQAVYTRAKRPAQKKYEETVAPVKELLKTTREAADALRKRDRRKASDDYGKVKREALKLYEKATGNRWPPSL